MTCRPPNFGIPGAGGREDCLYRLMISFSKIAEEIFNSYKRAQLVTAVKSRHSKKGWVLKYRSSGVGNSKRMRKAHPADMVYLNRSPDFCPGTKGRVCAKKIRSNIKSLHEYNPTIPMRFNVCSTLCCGRGHTTKPTIMELICTCRFSYSRMSLRCSKCPVVAEISIVRDSLSLDCKCHGMTATCAMHTCTRFLPMDFRGIANKLFQLYKKAPQVELADDASGKRKELVIKKQKDGETRKKLHANDIAYLLKSRDFCVPEAKNKLPGTKGRICGRKYIGNFAKSPFFDTAPINVCDDLCCGRKYITTRKRTTIEKCKCKFYINIMDVKCKDCHLITEIYSCS